MENDSDIQLTIISLLIVTCLLLKEKLKASARNKFSAFQFLTNAVVLNCFVF